MPSSLLPAQNSNSSRAPLTQNRVSIQAICRQINTSSTISCHGAGSVRMIDIHVPMEREGAWQVVKNLDKIG